ncbi:hypothetical protein M0805_006537 [Coniferiporia weirii]|nr:hypothetical protein M0805_006537 [Coniferiporia weirii]
MEDAGETRGLSNRITAQPWNEDDTPIVLVLVGLIASGGKGESDSTFAHALETLHFRRCNQDDLGDRGAVERLARSSLRDGISVCIDRTNFDETQRAHWNKIAREFPRSKLWCIICKDRLQRRVDHPTIRSPEEGIQVLYRFQGLFTQPTADEGFERIYHLKHSDHPSPDYSREQLQALLLEIAKSPPPARTAHQRGFRGRFGVDAPRRWGNGGGRGYSSHNRGYFQRTAYNERPDWRAGQSASGRDGPGQFSAGYTSSQRGGQGFWRRGGNAFQDDRVAKPTGQMSHAVSRIPEGTTSEGGTAESPIEIE